MVCYEQLLNTEQMRINLHEKNVYEKWSKAVIFQGEYFSRILIAASNLRPRTTSTTTLASHQQQQR